MTNTRLRSHTTRPPRRIAIGLVLAVSTVSCSGSDPESDTPDTTAPAVSTTMPTATTPAETPSSTPTSGTSETPIEAAETTIQIDGLADDWADVRAARFGDAVGDHTPYGMDVVGFSTFLGPNWLYGMVEFAEFGNYEHLSIVLADSDGSEWSIVVTPVAGLGKYWQNPDGVNFATQLDAAWDQVIEFRIERSELGFTPTEARAMGVFYEMAGEDPTDFVALGAPLPVLTDVVESESLEPGIRTERPGQVFLIDGSNAGYLHQSFVQIPIGLEWGPDGHLYVADTAGRHVVRIDKSGSMDDLGLWRNDLRWKRGGPEDVAFAPDGTMYLSDRQFLYRRLANGELERLDAAGFPGMLVFGPDGSLYYVDPGQNAVFRWTEAEGSELVATLTQPEDVDFLQDGRMVVLTLGGAIHTVDLATGDTQPFAQANRSQAPGYMTVAPDGDLWARVELGLERFGPDGRRKSFTVDGAEIGPRGEGLPAEMLGWDTSGDLTFDDEGALWVGSYNSRIWRFVDTTGDGDFVWGNIAPGFFTYDLTTHPDGSVFAHNQNTGAVSRYTEAGSEVVYQPDVPGQVYLAFDQAQTLHVATADGEIVRLGDDGNVSRVASLGVGSMSFGPDGTLYAAAHSQGGEPARIVTISEAGEVNTVVDTLGGQPIGDYSGEVAAASVSGSNEVFVDATADGLVIYDGSSARVYRVSYDGTDETLLYDFGWVTGRPWLTAVSPDGVPYFMYHLPAYHYQLGRVTAAGELEPVANDIGGDPFAMSFSPDGEYVYVAESGAIVAIPTAIDLPSGKIPSEPERPDASGPADDVSDDDRAALCTAYLGFFAAPPPERGGPLAELAAHVGDGAPAELNETIDILATADYGSTDVRPQLKVLGDYVLPLCVDSYEAAVVPAADDATAAAQFLTALIEGDRDLAAEVASELALVQFEPWDFRGIVNDFPRTVEAEGGFYIEITQERALQCEVSGGVVRTCHN